MTSLHLLGTGSGLINPRRCASAYLLETDRGDVLLDAGEPVSATLAGRSYDWSRLEGLCVTHAHADHTGGLPMLIQQLHLSGRSQPLSIYGPGEYIDRLFDLLGVHYLFPEAMRFRLTTSALAAGAEFEICDARFTAVLTRHLEPARARVSEFGYANRCEAFALRIELRGGPLFYSGDVGSFEDIREALSGCTHAILDSTHVDLHEILEWARIHPETQIVLSHVAPEFDARAATPEFLLADMNSVVIASEGSTIAL